MELKAEGNFEGYTLLVGFPGIGLVGTIVARHIVEELGMRYVGQIAGYEFPAVATVRNGQILPPIRLYALPEKKLACLVSDITIPDAVSYHMAEAIIKFVKQQKIARIISLAGIIVPKADEDVVYGVGATVKDLHEIQRYGITPVSRGMTTGISAAILLKAAEEGVPAALLLGQLHAKEDFRAAADVVKKLDEILGLSVDVGTLLDRAEKMERELAEISSKLRSHMEKYTPAMYG